VRRLHDPHGKWKYIHYATLPPMLFDLEADPYERSDLGATRNIRR